MEKKRIRVMKKKSLRQALVLIVVVSLVQFSFGQQQQNMDRNHNEQVTIIGSFDPTINQAYKINVRPEQNPFTFQSPEFSFQSLNAQVETDIMASQVKPLSIKSDKRVKTYDNYLRAGFGSQLTPLLDFYHSSGKSGSHRFDATINHFSSFSNIVDYSPSPYANTKAAINFEKYAKYSVLDFGLEYGLRTNRYYGYKPDEYPTLTIPEDDLKQSFNLIRANLGFGSKHTKSDKMHFTFDLSGYYYFDKHEAKETNANFIFDLHRGFEVTDVLDYQNIGLDGEISYFGNSDSVAKTTDIFLNAAPYFKAKYGVFAFKVALRFSYLMAEENSFHFYPVIDLSVTAIEDALVIYAGLDGNIQKNSYLNLTTVNPYFTPYGIADSSLGWQNNKLIVYAGVRGNITKKLGFDLGVGWNKFEDMTFFVNTSEYFVQPDTSIPVFVGTNNKFTILHDNGSVFKLKGELSYAVDARFKIWLAGQYYSYSLDSLKNPYHKPISEIKLGASYLVKNKLKVWTEIYSYGKRYAQIRSGVIDDIEIDGFIDINLGAEYYISDTFSVFLDASNLLNNNYDRFYSFPVQGINIMAGVALKF